VSFLGELRVSSLSYDQIGEICEMAEEAARRTILSRVPSRGISDLSISVASDGTETLAVEVEVEISLSPLFRNVDAKKLTEESVEAAFGAIEKHLREIGCQYER